MNALGDRAPMLPLWVALGIAVGIALTRAISVLAAPESVLAVADNDSLMRLVSVREWLAGQGWFDMTMHRAMPPEGLSLHWSRYVDAGIAGVLLLVAQVFPPEQAEAVTLVLWPTLLLFVLTATMARAGLALFGPMAAAITVLAVVLWPVTGHNYFRPGVIDHHNVQILLLTFLILSLFGTEKFVWRGIGGGIAAALSLAVGLENLLPIAVFGLILLVRSAMSPQDHGRHLAAFATTLAVCSTMLFVGQVPRLEWMVRHCDEFAPPVLALVWIAVAVSVSATLMLRRFHGQAARAGVATVCATLGIAAALPILMTCAGGPYGALPEDVKAIIGTRIVETRPAHAFALEGCMIFFTHILPAFLTVLVASILWKFERSATGIDERRRSAAGVLLIFGWLGVIAGIFQFRLLVLAAPAIPLLMGFALARLLEKRAAHRESLVAAVALIATAGVTVFMPALALSVSIVRAATASTAGAVSPTAAAAACRKHEVVGALDQLPAGRILSDLNLGTPILASTGHDVLSAPYHRSADAFRNGIVPFDGDEAALRDAIARSGADYVVFCRAEITGDGSAFWEDLRSHKGAVGLAPVDGQDPVLVVLKVER